MNTIKRYLYKFLRIILKSVMIVFLIAFMGWIWWGYLYGRGVYKLGNEQYVTVWKRGGGDCYVMPYKYCGLILPDKNFILADNLGSIGIYYKEDSTLIIDDGMRGKGNKMEDVKGVYLPDYKHEFLEYPDCSHLSVDERLDTLKIFEHKLAEKKYMHISISIREPYVKIDQ